MKNPNPDERNSKTFAFIIIVALIMTILMRGVNTRMDVPHILYVAVAVLSGVVSIISYIGFIYCKMYKPVGSQILMDMIKIILLGVIVYFTVTFSITVISNL
ncbi:hypothetical protein ACPPVU_09605 [Mucilaginibacter sp. McL0603]|uniref:hypothetical protein n=1 Tax=Mucilaginibacter sp. McL0603 TaxID=3415670 RepID=UPI003CF59DFC